MILPKKIEKSIVLSEKNNPSALDGVWKIEPQEKILTIKASKKLQLH